MAIQFFYLISVSVAFYASYLLLKSGLRSSKKKVRFRSNFYQRSLERLSKNFVSTSTDAVFKQIGVNVTSLNYNILRLIVCGIIGFTIFNSYVTTQVLAVNQILLIFIFWFATEPVKSIGTIKTPFGWAIGFIEGRHNRKKDFEISLSLAQLKNMALNQTQNNYSGDYVVEQLSKFSNVLKPSFIQMLAIWRVQGATKACEFFGDSVGTKLGYDFANILLKLDAVDPNELSEQLILIQQHIKETRQTEQLKKQEGISNLIFLPQVILALIILLNFVIITVWLDTMQRIGFF